MSITSISETASKSGFHSETGIISSLTGLAAGTRISTPDGEVAVETLQRGDLVLTPSGEAKPVRWRRVSDVAGQFTGQLHAAPICIKAGTLGENLPRRDLRVAPAHALYLDGFLVQATALVDGFGITRETMPDHFRYYHVLLDAHELLMTEGMPSESFADEADPAFGLLPAMDLPRVTSYWQVPAGLKARLAARAGLYPVSSNAA